MKTSETIYKEACKVLAGGVSRNTLYRKPHPQYAENASGCYITDIEGTERVDFANNMAALIHGHAYPPVVEAVTEQLRRGTAYTLASEIEVAYAKALTGRAKGFEKIRFVNSGTEAVMAMIKASRAFTGRPKIAKAEGTYHGTYDFAEVSQTSHPLNWGPPDNPSSVPLVYGTPDGVLENVVIFPFNDTERTLAILDRHAGQVACVMIDPIPLRIGLTGARPDYIEALGDWTRRNGALLVFDEVVTFRVSYGGAQEWYNVTPDLTAMGKIIGGGFPVGALAGRSDVMQVFDPRESNLRFPHSGTFSANPITMTAGFTAMNHYDRDAVERLNQLTAIAIRQISEAIQLAGVPVSITGSGSMFRMHLRATPPLTYREAYLSKEVSTVVNELIEQLYYREKILMINTFACTLSTVMTQKEIDRLTNGLLNSFRAFRDRIMRLQSI